VADAPYQSLYRRYRPQRFGEILGQDHITQALRNAVRQDRVAHGYLFSGPRGTGKTTSARVLAKALNCAKLDDGEPCGMCESCHAVQAGSSYDVIELDAASNRGIDRMRSLLEGVALGTGGRRKVYIIDEVHMLTPEASAALLKTLEEPPAHVVFVLATTDPQKVLPTIRSRVQNFEFRLMNLAVLTALVRSVSDDAGISLEGDAVEAVARRGAGSARDALSVLDQVAALGHLDDTVAATGEVLEAICERDTARALSAVAEAVAAGRDARRLAEEILDALRTAFLAVMAPDLVDLSGDDASRVADVGNRMGAATAVRAMEAIGAALADMRDALDPRVLLDVAVVRLTRPDVDPSPAALLDRIERLERALAEGAPPAAGPEPTSPAAGPPPAAAPATAAGPATARGALGAHRRNPAAAPPPAAKSADPVPPPVAAPSPSPATAGSFPSRDELTRVWGDQILAALRQRARARFRPGRWVSAADGDVVFALPNAIHRDRCEEVRAEVETALANHFGLPVRLRLVVDDAVTVPVGDSAGRDRPAAAPDDDIQPGELTDAPPLASPEDRIKQAFPGAEEVDG
jgi:DNA polymerase-3 subunit gamma/tau